VGRCGLQDRGVAGALMWDHWFDQILCKLFRQFGGSCEELPEKPDDKARAVDEAYREGGPPEFSGPEKKAEFLADLTELEQGLAQPECSLSPECRELLTVMISDLRAELEP
jgi:hypothetical protein